MTPRPARQTYFVRGTYRDGQVHSTHVDTDDLEAYLRYERTAALFPTFDHVVVVCDDFFNCTHGQDEVTS